MNRLGPKTHLFVLILASILSTLVSNQLQAHLMVLASALYMLGNKLSKKSLSFVLLYIALMAILSILPNGAGTATIILYTFARMIPMIMIGMVLMHSTPSSIMCAFERVYVPKPVLIMICILIRFFPVVLLEMKAIRDGIRARGIFPQWYSALLHPAMSYECFFMPLIVRCLKLSAELSSSAELRGIECGCARTSIHPIEFRAADGMAIGLYALIGAAIYWTGGLNL
ncbi:energy-coupling factor transporter transmembrane component T family protein [Aneurinibacillus aneurinilyticus]|uniref:Energy-coupling factor transporter transmembrane protein EcfT n=2 Tax=Aneurinibacillus aneurinilyticus TaxID=1391 RepID=A0A848CZ65_ANEAE|nr:energy-coupling factor transporter transmembrane component T [Aneurinibacillus aneurinilyticus]ERI11054.1 cobalt transport protein [Aneurinibacillus aneurinilyticus ATCC 12856]MED0670267.1 energy-coupling factor transporter transmembrane component T [Aneurinibacillus aneurinilyticus]MED0708769.1 energy-coupling factor transporter transmembrane component T [Aneurinibacillus aneurinilyticus]MED0722752.1 energy-coupling factor transporter transmembrane component T [Aneurinibacillus aneurinilyti